MDVIHNKKKTDLYKKKHSQLTFQYGSSSNRSLEKVGWKMGSQRTIRPTQDNQIVYNQNQHYLFGLQWYSRFLLGREKC